MMNYAQYTDEQLVALAQADDTKAYNNLLARYDNKIYQIILFNINDTANVKDLKQEVLIKAYRSLQDFKIDSRFSTWIYRITQNTIKNHYRMQSQRQASETQFAIEQNYDNSGSPEQILMNSEFKQKVDEEIAKLPQAIRVCYGMYTFEGETYEHIAEKMQCPVGTVRSRIFRARQMLSKCKAQSNVNMP